MKKESIDYWFHYVAGGHDTAEDMLNALCKETPPLISWVGERSCNLQCAHCIFQDEKSYGENKSIGNTLISLASHISQYHPPVLIHEGRIIRKWHLPIIKKLKECNISVGLIDNGTYEKFIDDFEVKLDWIDISIDGTKEFHNFQRRNENAYQTAISGIKSGRKIANKVTSLFTLTSLNYGNLYDACSAVIDHVDEFHIIPVSPVRPEILFTETNKGQMKIAWEQIKKLNHEYSGKIFMRMYQYEDIAKIASIDPLLFKDSAKNPKGVSHGKIIFEFQGVSFSYFPKSISINETMVIDTDNWYRLPYSIKHSVSELVSGIDLFGNDISAYSIAELSEHTDFKAVYLRAVKSWWYNFGRQSLEKEKHFFSTFH